MLYPLSYRRGARPSYLPRWWEIELSRPDNSVTMPTRLPAMPAVLDALLTRVINRPLAAYVARRTMPTTDQTISRLEASFRRSAMICAGGTGMAACLPKTSSLAVKLLAGAEVLTLVGAATWHALAVARVYEVSDADVEQRKAFVVTALLGPSGTELVADAGQVSPTLVAKTILIGLPPSQLTRTSSRLLRPFARKGAKSAQVRLLPCAIGAGIGIVSGRAFAAMVMSELRAAFPRPTDCSALPHCDH